MATEPGPSARLFIASALVSVLLALALLVLFLRSDSYIALAQAADSGADAMVGVALLWAMQLSRKPADDSHPFGHQSAQPIAALVVAVLACVLAIEVARDAVTSLLGDNAMRFDAWIPAVLAVKVAIKILFVMLVSRAGTLAEGSALKAFQVDARNDVLVGSASLVGFGAAQWGGLPSLDGWLALVVAGWVGWSGVSLAWESATVLMGAAAPAARRDELRALAAETESVARVAALKARVQGEQLHVWLEIHVHPQLSVGEAHCIAEAVEDRLKAEADVADAVVHIDAAV